MDPRLALADVGAYAQRIEAMGFDGLHVAETIHDAFMASTLAAEHTERITIRTSVAVAFIRSPMLVAYSAWDLAQLSGGRFELGLGTQIRQNIEDRFGMPWTAPVERMREYVEVVRAAFESFRSGDPPHIRGEHYSVSRLQPYFNPGPDATATPPAIWLGGVNTRMCELAGEVADGFVTHPTNSDPRYVREVVVPALEYGGKLSQTTREVATQLVVAGNLVMGATDREVAAERERQRRVLAFLYSTPAYARTLELHGHGDLPARLRETIKRETWDELGDLIADDLLDALVVSGRYDEVGDKIMQTWQGLVDGVVVGPQADADCDSHVAALVAELHAA